MGLQTIYQEEASAFQVSVTEYFDFLQSKVCYKHWLSGYIHLDVMISSKHTVVYRDFILAEEMIKYGNEN
jgi:hypothetical protein